MNDRRFQVFVSSTFLDLQEERAAVVSALLQMDAFPAGMELFPATDDDSWTLIQRVIDSSDYYLLVVGGKYGSIDPKTELSYTEMEYDYAVKQGKRVMAFLHGEPEKIEFGKSEAESGAREKLDEFRAKVRETKHVKFWVGKDDLAGKVALTFASFQQSYPAVGWVRGDVEASSEALAELNELRKKVAELERQRERSRREPPPGTEHLSGATDWVPLKPEFRARIGIRGEHVAHDFYQTNYHTVSGPLGVPFIWDDYFAVIGPLMIDEATESDIRSRISDWLTKRFLSMVKQRIATMYEDRGETIANFGDIRISLTTDDFGTLIIQLRALGLMEKSERSRSVKDKATYWSLTPYGDERLTTLRAIRRYDASDNEVPTDVRTAEAEIEVTRD